MCKCVKQQIRPAPSNWEDSQSQTQPQSARQMLTRRIRAAAVAVRAETREPYSGRVLRFPLLSSSIRYVDNAHGTRGPSLHFVAIVGVFRCRGATAAGSHYGSVPLSGANVDARRARRAGGLADPHAVDGSLAYVHEHATGHDTCCSMERAEDAISRNSGVDVQGLLTRMRTRVSL